MNKELGLEAKAKESDIYWGDLLAAIKQKNEKYAISIIDKNINNQDFLLKRSLGLPLHILVKRRGLQALLTKIESLDIYTNNESDVGDDSANDNSDLIKAIKDKNEELAISLVEKNKMNTTYLTNRDSGFSPVMLATGGNLPNLIKVLVSDYFVEPDEVTQTGETSLSSALKMPERIEVMQALLDGGANMDLSIEYLLMTGGTDIGKVIEQMLDNSTLDGAKKDLLRVIVFAPMLPLLKSGDIKNLDGRVSVSFNFNQHADKLKNIMGLTKEDESIPVVDKEHIFYPPEIILDVLEGRKSEEDLLNKVKSISNDDILPQ